MRKSLIILLLAIFTTLGALAQSITFKSSAPLTVIEGNRFQVEFVLTNAQGSGFVAPKFEGLRVLSGPNVSMGTSFSSINGVTSQSSSETYTYYVEANRDAKKATISSASITAEGKVYKTEALAISIGKPGSTPQQSGGGNSSQQNSSAQDIDYNRNKTELASDDILLRLEVSNRNPYKGEAISAQLKLYTRVGISRFNDINYPSLGGFWTQEIEVPQNGGRGRQTISGKVYEAVVLRQWLLYPQRSGEIIIDPASLELVAQIVSRASGTSMYDQFFGGGSSVNSVSKRLSTPKIKLNVKALPDGAPVGLPVAVGDFELSSQLSDSNIVANSAASLSVILKGSGDFPLMDIPHFSLPAEFEQYDTKVDDRLRSRLGGTSGERVWEFPFVARSEGDFTIPSLEFAYFNPKTKKYQLLKTPEYNLNVQRDASASGSTVVTGINREDLEILGEDIRYIITSPVGVASSSMALYSSTFFIIIVVLIAAALLAISLLKVQDRRRADVVGTKTRKASKVALRRLKSAKKQLDANNRALFFEETLKALWGFVGDRYSIDMAELTKDRIREEFASRGVDSALSDEFVSLVEECEMAQYAPVASLDMGAIYSRALSLFDSL